MKMIGVGNETRGDDGVGIVVARRLAELQLSGVDIEIQCGDGAALLESCNRESHVVVVDCSKTGASPGTIRHILAHEEPLGLAFFGGSTHTFGVGEAIELGRILDQLPEILEVYAIEGGNFSAGSPLSEPVRSAADEIVRVLAKRCGAGI